MLDRFLRRVDRLLDRGTRVGGWYRRICMCSKYYNESGRRGIIKGTRSGRRSHRRSESGNGRRNASGSGRKTVLRIERESGRRIRRGSGRRIEKLSGSGSIENGNERGNERRGKRSSIRDVDDPFRPSDEDRFRLRLDVVLPRLPLDVVLPLPLLDVARHRQCITDVDDPLLLRLAARVLPPRLEFSNIPSRDEFPPALLPSLLIRWSAGRIRVTRRRRTPDDNDQERENCLRRRRNEPDRDPLHLLSPLDCDTTPDPALARLRPSIGIVENAPCLAIDPSFEKDRFAIDPDRPTPLDELTLVTYVRTRGMVERIRGKEQDR